MTVTTGGKLLRFPLDAWNRVIDQTISNLPSCPFSKTKIALKQRNFDPVTRQPAQHAANGPIEDAAEGDEQDAAQAKETVEKRMEGVAERILQEDESKRRQELVSVA